MDKLLFYKSVLIGNLMIIFLTQNFLYFEFFVFVKFQQVLMHHRVSSSPQVGEVFAKFHNNSQLWNLSLPNTKVLSFYVTQKVITPCLGCFM